MSILIKGMEMPRDCTVCRFCNDRTLFCWATREFITEFGHPKFCPLEEVPETHDKRTETHACDLIDRRAVKDWLAKWEGYIDSDIIARMQYRVIDIPSAQPDKTKITDDEARFTLHQIGAYFSIKIRDGKEGNIPIELHEKVEELRRYIAKLESAQPELIRCRDCKFYSPMNRETKTGICNLTMHQNFGDNWFCAGAERRTDEQTN